jgi:hypothetical protein
MSQTYPTIYRVLEPWQSGSVGYILPTSDISDATKISTIGFRMEGAKLEDLNIQGVLKQEKGLKGIKKSR